MGPKLITEFPILVAPESTWVIAVGDPNNGTLYQTPIGSIVAGPQGAQGVQGLTGFQGFQGHQGGQGWQGLQGLTGLQGYQGQGLQGLMGYQGAQGVQGLTGAQGFQGHQGGQGWQGLQGLMGYQGNIGFQGPPGEGYYGEMYFQGTYSLTATASNTNYKLNTVYQSDINNGFTYSVGSIHSNVSGIFHIIITLSYTDGNNNDWFFEVTNNGIQVSGIKMNSTSFNNGYMSICMSGLEYVNVGDVFELYVRSSSPNNIIHISLINFNICSVSGSIGPQGLQGPNQTIFYSGTYSQIATLKSTNSLIPGYMYEITNYGGPVKSVFLLATSINTFAEQGYSSQWCPKYYSPGTHSSISWLGVWRNTLTTSIGNYVIWGAQVWTNTSGNVGSDINDIELSTDWTLVNYDSNSYVLKQFTISFDFDNNFITSQSDGSNKNVCPYQLFNNIGTVYNPNVYYDWNFSTSDLFCENYTILSFLNNLQDGNEKSFNKATLIHKNSGEILENNCSGQIINNSVTQIFGNFCDTISDNIISGVIYHNFIPRKSIYSNTCGNIQFNINRGDIFQNSNNGVIEKNFNSGSISYNANTGYIKNNGNNGDISLNICRNIYNNSNNGVINQNSNANDIFLNANDGDIILNESPIQSIWNNTNTGRIFANANNGDIVFNFSSVKEISSNNNNGSIQNNNCNGTISINSSPTKNIDGNKNNGNINDNLIDGNIQNNFCNGSINSNTCLGDIKQNKNIGNISFNENNGDINHNINNGDIRSIGNTTTNIEYNTNNGEISTTVVGVISDSVVNK